MTDVDRRTQENLTATTNRASFGQLVQGGPAIIMLLIRIRRRSAEARGCCAAFAKHSLRSVARARRLRRAPLQALRACASLRSLQRERSRASGSGDAHRIHGARGGNDSVCACTKAPREGWCSPPRWENASRPPGAKRRLSPQNLTQIRP